MHCVVSWDISEAGYPAREVLSTLLLQHLASLSYVKPLTTFYIVKVWNQIQYDALVGGLLGVAQGYPARIRLVISPMMAGGTYNGFLDANLWPDINARTQ